MARPRYVAGDETAREKLGAAFWLLLADRPYTTLTVLDVVRAAGVNKNTFYYHYSGIDELAEDAVAGTLDPDALLTALTALRHHDQGDGPRVDAEFDARLDRLCLIAGTHSSPALRQHLKDGLHNAWAQVLQLDDSQLTLEQRLGVEFALGGILELMAFRFSVGNAVSFTTAATVITRSGMLEAFVRSTGATWSFAPDPAN